MSGLPLSPEDMLRLCELQRNEAYKSFVSTIECEATRREVVGDQPAWLDINDALQDEDFGVVLEFHPEHENWVRIKPLSESRA